MDQNPYASPQTTADADMARILGASWEPAGQGRRFVNFLIDGIIGRIVVIGAWIVVAIIAAALGYGNILEDISTATDIILSTSMFLAFYFAQEALFQRTIGKLLTGTVVVNEDGSRPTIAQIAGRTLSRAIPFEPFSAFGGKVPHPWHDKLSGTRVVRVVG